MNSRSIDNERNNWHGDCVFTFKNISENPFDRDITDKLPNDIAIGEFKSNPSKVSQVFFFNENAKQVELLHNTNTSPSMIVNSEPVLSIPSLIKNIKIPTYETGSIKEDDIQQQFTESFNHQSVKIDQTDEFDANLKQRKKTLMQAARKQDKDDVLQKFVRYLGSGNLPTIPHKEHKNLNVLLFSGFIYQQIGKKAIDKCFTDENFDECNKECASESEDDTCASCICDYVSKLSTLITHKESDVLYMVKLYIYMYFLS